MKKIPQTIAELHESLVDTFGRRFDAIDERFGRVDTAIVDIHKRFEHVDDLLETIAMATNAHTTKISEIDAASGDHGVRIERLERSVARLNLKLVH